MTLEEAESVINTYGRLVPNNKDISDEEYDIVKEACKWIIIGCDNSVIRLKALTVIEYLYEGLRDRHE